MLEMQESCAWLAVLVILLLLLLASCFCFCFMQCKNLHLLLLCCAALRSHHIPSYPNEPCSLTSLGRGRGLTGLPPVVLPPLVPSHWIDRARAGSCGLRDDEPLTNGRASQWRTVPALQNPRELPYHAVGSCSPVDASQSFLPIANVASHPLHPLTRTGSPCHAYGFFSLPWRWRG